MYAGRELSWKFEVVSLGELTSGFRKERFDCVDVVSVVHTERGKRSRMIEEGRMRIYYLGSDKTSHLSVGRS